MSHLWVLSAASGTGKTSLVKALLADDRQTQVAVSHTTREPREGEVHGKDYYFVDQDGFLKLQRKQAFVEFAQVFDNYYGTSLQEVQHRIQAGYDVILEIDWQGAQQIRKAMPDAKSIFIFPPSLADLRARLEGRGTDKKSVIEHRLAKAKQEISHASEFDYWVVNDDFDKALAALRSIIKAHRFEQRLMEAKHPSLLRTLCGT